MSHEYNFNGYNYREGYESYKADLIERRRVAIAKGISGVTIDPKWCDACKYVADGDHHCFWVESYKVGA